MSLPLKWVRPTDVPYPKIWMTFKERDANSDKLVEYRIQDLPESMFEDAIKLMANVCVADEPLVASYNVINDPEVIEDHVRLWRILLPQKCVLVCLRADSNEIIGANFNYVLCKSDTLPKDLKLVSKSETFGYLTRILDILCKDFDIFDKYNLDIIHSSFGLAVTREYRGRGIGQRLLQTRKLFGETFGLKATYAIFSSDFSNAIADKAGFKADMSYSFDELSAIDPTLNLRNVKSSGIAIKTWVF